MPYAQINTRAARMKHLSVKATKRSPSLMIDEGVVYKSRAMTGFEYPHRQVHIFAETHRCEAGYFLEHAASYAHIKGTRDESGDFLLSSANASGSKKRSHRIAYGSLKRRERVVRTVRPSEQIHLIFSKITLYSLEIAGRNGGIGIQEDKILSLSITSAIISRGRRTSVSLTQVLYGKTARIAFYHSIARHGGTVFDYYDGIVGVALLGKTMQKAFYLVRSVINRYDYGKTHYSRMKSAKNSGR